MTKANYQVCSPGTDPGAASHAPAARAGPGTADRGRAQQRAALGRPHRRQAGPTGAHAVCNHARTILALPLSPVAVLFPAMAAARPFSERAVNRPKKETLDRRRSTLKAEQAARRGVRGAARQALTGSRGGASNAGGSARGGKSPVGIAAGRPGKYNSQGAATSTRRTSVPKQRGLKFK